MFCNGLIRKTTRLSFSSVACNTSSDSWSQDIAQSIGLEYFCRVGKSIGCGWLKREMWLLLEFWRGVGDKFSRWSFFSPSLKLWINKAARSNSIIFAHRKYRAQFCGNGQPQRFKEIEHDHAMCIHNMVSIHHIFCTHHCRLQNDINASLERNIIAVDRERGKDC